MTRFPSLYIIMCIAAAVICAGAASCSRSKYGALLDRAEAIMMEHPDSAMLIIDSIPVSALSSDHDRALFGMLRTEARDKNHLSLENDSLILFSIDHFRRTGDATRLMISLYYNGRVRFLSDNNPLALVSYLQALEIAEQNNEYFWAGMACRGISDIYNLSFNLSEELIYAKKELEYIKKSGRQPYINYAMLDYARALNNNGKFEEALEISKQIIDSALISNDYYLHEDGQRIAAVAYFASDSKNEAINIWQSICQNGGGTFVDSTRMSISYATIGNVNRAKEILSMLSCKDSLHYIEALCRISQAENNLPEALQYFSIMDSLTNNTFKKSIDTKLTTAVADFYTIATQKVKADLQYSRKITWLFIIIAILIMGLIVLSTSNIIHRMRKTTAEKVLLAEQLQKMLEKSKTETTAASMAFKELLSTKYELLEELCTIVLTNPDTRAARHKIAEKVTTLIRDISLNGVKVKELEQKVDTMHNNLFTDFRKDFPNLKEADYCLYLFLILGLSHSAISLFLKEEKVSAVYERKRRLKDRIKRAEKLKQDRYLPYLL